MNRKASDPLSTSLSKGVSFQEPRRSFLGSNNCGLSQMAVAAHSGFSTLTMDRSLPPSGSQFSHRLNEMVSLDHSFIHCTNIYEEFALWLGSQKPVAAWTGG